MLRENGIKEWMFDEINTSYERAFINGVPTADTVYFLETHALTMLVSLSYKNTSKKKRIRYENCGT